MRALISNIKINYLIKYNKLISKRIIQNKLFTIQDIIDAFELSNLNLFDFIIVGKVNNNVVSSLSVHFMENKPILFNSSSKLINLLNKLNLYDININSIFKSSDSYNVFFSNHFALFFPTCLFNKLNNIDVKNIIKYIFLISEKIREHSLHAINMNKDKDIEKYNILRNILKKESDFNVSDICSFIKNNENICSMAIYVKTLKSINISSNECEHFEDIMKNFFIIESDGYQNYIKPLLAETIRTGKPMGGRHGTKELQLYFIMIPVMRKVDSPIKIKYIILLHSIENISIEKMNRIIDYIDMYVTFMLSDRKLNTIVKIQQDAINVKRLLRKTNIRSYNDLEIAFRSYLESYLKEIINSTHAYSVVVRLYDPSLKSLEVFSEFKTKHGERDNLPKLSSISIKKYAHESVNVFTFLDGGYSFNYIYIENTREKLNDKLKLAGLNKALPARDNTLSEICFPLLCGDICFGVLNIESQIRDAFDEDIRYLYAVKQAIETYYSNLYYSSDYHWINTQINRYDNIHELKNYALLGHFDKKTQNILSKFLWPTPPKNEICENCLFKDAIVNNINDFIGAMYSQLSDANINFLKGVMEYNINDEIQVNNEILNNIFIIVKNLLQNVVRYGDQLRDKIIISTYPLFKYGDKQTIRIRLKTFGKFDDTTLSKMGIMPTIDIEGKPHFGMFLVGMLSRIMGGTMHVSKKENMPFTIVEIRIPRVGRL